MSTTTYCAKSSRTRALCVDDRVIIVLSGEENVDAVGFLGGVRD